MTPVKTVFKDRYLVVVPESADEQLELAAWLEGREGRMFALASRPGEIETPRGLALRDVGPREEICREPINVTSRAADPQVRLISNFAPAPFELDGRAYASVEGFWQGLKYPKAADRRRVAALVAGEAKRAGEDIDYEATLEYEGRTIVPGTWDHWQLMHAACWAKFSQHDESRAALLSTGNRPLTHIMRHDSHTIPGAIMAEIWMKVRARLRSPRGSASGADLIVDAAVDDADG